MGLWERWSSGSPLASLNSSTGGPPNVTVIDKLKLSLISWWQFLLKEKESGASDRQTDPHWLPVFLLADCLGKDLQSRIVPIMALTVLPLLTHQACSYLHSLLFITHFCYPARLYFLLPIPVTFEFLGIVAVLRFSSIHSVSVALLWWFSTWSERSLPTI